jgi:chromosome segregation ATPase
MDERAELQRWVDASSIEASEREERERESEVRVQKEREEREREKEKDIYEMKDREEKIAGLEGSIKEKDRSLADLSTQLATAHSSVQALQSEKTALEFTYNSLQTTYTALQLSNDQHQRTSEEKNAIIASLTQNTQTVEEAETAKIALQQRLDDLSKELTEKNDALSTIIAENAKIAQEKATIADDLQSESIQLERARRELEAKSEEMAMIVRSNEEKVDTLIHTCIHS